MSFMSPRRKGLFVVLEGPDKSGKSTQARRLVGALLAKGVRVLHKREPGGTGVAEKVREILLDPSLHVTPTAELFLYEASRAQHTEEVLKPALESGHVIVCERYTMSTDAYQGAGRGLGLKTTAALNRIATGGLTPDMTFVLDIPETEFSKRDQSRKLDRLELETEKFKRLVRKAYHSLSLKTKGAIRLDGTRPEDELHREILARVEKRLP